MKRTKLLISLLLLCALAVNLAGCAKAGATNLMDGITPRLLDLRVDLSLQNPNVTDFAVRLFKASEEKGKNTLVSPLSVLSALAMTANGAQGETLSQMESVFGIRSKELNEYMYTYMDTLPTGDKYKLSLANSIWFTDSLDVSGSFLQTNGDYYGADIYKAPFDSQTCGEINAWVKEKTEGMIPEIIKQIPEQTVMYLINALAFEAEWLRVYEKSQVSEGEFTKEDGTKQKADFMHSQEGSYLEDERATGFIKYYKDRKYAFVAMLPKEDVSLSDYVASLQGDALNTLLKNPQYTTVYASIPKFETEYNAEMKDVLKGMGMPKAFDPQDAEFGRMLEGGAADLHIGGVIHKTFISVGEKGTKAGAATAVHMDLAGMETPEEIKEVKLDRPFVYMLIDCKNNVPFFMGTMRDIEK